MTADAKDLIVFVHGTGSANPADEGQKWWQLGSSFSNELGALQTCAILARPFHWSGLNSELARRRAGSALLERLQQMEASGQRYHLVGHSHGGSVIWHALTQSAAQGKRLACLQSWCTVGTPYLTVAPRWPNAWRWVTALLVTVAFSSLVYTSGALELPSVVPEIWGDGRRWSLIGYLALLAAALGLWLWAVARALLPAAARLLYSSKLGIPATAAGWYGETWLGLWHPLDEPINSLAGTLGPAPRIAPRRKESLLFRAIPLLGSVWDTVLLRAADEFAWRQVTNRAQGADLVNQFVLDVGRAPQPLEPGFNPLPQQLADQMTASANAHSEGLVASMRALLERAYDQRNTETIADRVGTLLTFQELIHTSYFGQPAVAKMIAAHIDQCAAPGGRLPAAFEPARADVASTRVAGSLPPRGALEFVTALVLLILPAITLWVSVRTTGEAVIIPYTSAYQFESIRDYVTQRRVLGAGSGGRLAALLLGLETQGLVADPVLILDRIPQGQHRRQAATRLAYAYGRSGRIKDVERLLAREEPERKAEYDARIRLLAFIGNAARRDPSARSAGVVEGLVPARPGSTGLAPAFLALIDSYFDHLQDTSDLSVDVRSDLNAIALTQMGLLGLADRGQRLIDFATTPGAQYPPPAICSFTTAFGEGVAVASPNANLGSLVDQCPIDHSRNKRVDLKGNMRRQIAAQVLLARKISGLQVHAAANDFSPLSQDQIEDALFTAKDEDDLARKVRELLPDIILLEQNLSREQIALISRNDSWAARLARNYVGPIAMLARLAFELDARQLSNALLDLLLRQSAAKNADQSDVALVIQALAACGRQNEGRQLFLGYVNDIGSRKSESIDDRLATLSMLIVAASHLADDASVKRYADELLQEHVKEPKSETLIGMSGAIAPVWKVDPVRGRALLAATLDDASLLDDAARDSVTRALAGEMTREAAIRKARLTALQITETDGALQVLLGIVKQADKLNSLDFRELGPAASLVQKLTEEHLQDVLDNL
jgi:hypothetical protein